MRCDMRVESHRCDRAIKDVDLLPIYEPRDVRRGKTCRDDIARLRALR